MRKDILLALIASSTAGTMFAADGAIQAGAWTFTGVYGSDLTNTGTDVNVPNVATTAAFCNLGTLNPGKYTVTYNTLTNGTLQWATTLSTDGAKDLPTDGVIEITSATPVYLVLTSADGQEGYGITGLAVSVSFDFIGAADDLQDALDAATTNEDGTSTLNSLTLNSYTNATLKGRYNAILTSITTIQGDIKEVNNNPSFKTYNDYELYANPNKIQKAITTLISQIEAINPEITAENARLVDVDNNFSQVTTWENQITQIQNGLDGLGIDIEDEKTPASLVTLVKAAQTSIDSASATVKNLKEIADEDAFTDAEKKSATDAIQAANEALEAVKTAYIYQPNYDKVYGEDGLVEQLKQVVKDQKVLAYDLLPVLQLQANEEIDKLYNEAIAQLKITGVNATATDENLTIDENTISDYKTQIEAVVATYASAQVAVQAYQTQLNNDLGTAGDEYGNCRPVRIDGIKALADAAQTAINTYAAGYQDGAPTAPVEAALTALEDAIKTAVGEKKAYEDIINPETGAIGSLVSNFDAVNESLEDQCAPLSKDHGFDIFAAFDASKASVQAGIDKLVEDNEAAYGTEGVAYIPNFDTIVTSLNSAVTTYKTACQSVIDAITEIGPNLNKAKIYATAIQPGIDGLYAGPDTSNAQGTLTTYKNKITTYVTNINGTSSDQGSYEYKLQQALSQNLTGQALVDAVMAVNNEVVGLPAALKALLSEAAAKVAQANQTVIVNGAAADLTTIGSVTTTKVDAAKWINNLKTTVSGATIPAVVTTGIEITTTPEPEDYEGDDWVGDQLAQAVTVALADYTAYQPTIEGWYNKLVSANETAAAIKLNEDNYKAYTTLTAGAAIATDQAANAAYIATVENAAIKTVYNDKNTELNNKYTTLTSDVEAKYQALKIIESDGLLKVANAGLNEDNFSTELNSAISAIKNFKKQMQANDSYYNTIADATYKVNNLASEYLVNIVEKDPADVTGAQATINGELEKLFKINNEVWDLYKGIALTADTYDDYEAQIETIEAAIKAANTAFYGEIGAANDKMLKEPLVEVDGTMLSWKDALKNANDAFNKGAYIYDSVYSISNVDLKEDINDALGVDYLPTYHTNLYGNYEKITATEANIDSAVQACNENGTVISASTVVDYINTLVRITGDIDTPAEALNTTVLGVINNAFKAAKTAAQKQLTDTKNTLDAAIQLTQETDEDGTPVVDENGNPVYVDNIFYQAQQKVLAGPQKNYDNAVNTYNTNIADPYSVIDDVLNTLNGISDGINTGVLFGTYTTWYTQEYNKSVTPEITKFNGFVQEVKDQYQTQWNNAIDAINQIKTDWIELNKDKGDLVANFTPYVNDLNSKIDAMQKLLATIKAANDAATGNTDRLNTWNVEVYPELEGQVDNLAAYVNSIAAAYTVATDLAAVENDLSTLDTKITTATTVPVDYDFGDGTATPDEITADVEACKLKACVNEVTILKNGVKDLYAAFNRAKATAEEAGTSSTEINGWYKDIQAISAEVDALPNYSALDAEAAANTDFFVTLETKISAEASFLAEKSGWNAVTADIEPLLNSQFNTTNNDLEHALDNVTVPYIKAKYQEEIDNLAKDLTAEQTAWGEDSRLLLTYQNYIADMKDISAEAADITTAAEAYNADEEASDANAQVLQTNLDEVSAAVNAAVNDINDWNGMKVVNLESSLNTLEGTVEGQVNYKDQIEALQDKIDAGTAEWVMGFKENTSEDYTSVNSAINTLNDAVWGLRVSDAYLTWNTVIYSTTQARNQAYSKYYAATGALKNILWNMLLEADTQYTALNPVQSIYETGQTSAEYVEYASENIKEVYAVYVAYQEICNIDTSITVGDINVDGDVDVMDYIELLYIVLDTDKQASLSDIEKLYADINGDGKFNIADLTTLKWFINHEGEEVDAEVVTRAYAASVHGTNTIQLVNMGTEDGVSRIGVYVENAAAFAGVQFDLNLADGMEVVSESIADRASALELYSHDNGNSHRVVLISQEDNVLDGNKGFVAFFEVRGTGDITVSGALAADARSHEYVLGSMGAITTGIESILNDGDLRDAEIYNVQGQKVNRMQQGVNFIRKADGTVVKMFNK